MSFLMKGKRARAAWKQAEKEHKVRKEEMENMVYRYYLPTGASGKITFLDGKLGPDGLIDVNMIKEHNLHMNGHWKNWFLCTEHGGEGEDGSPPSEPCPICEGGDKPYSAAVFTIVDWSKWEDKKGKTHQYEIKLFVAKREALNILQKRATKYKGLAGCTFEVERAGDNSPNVGNVFDFVNKHPLKTLVGAFAKRGVKLGLINYEKRLKYRTADELRKLGFGTGQPVGSEKAVEEEEFDGSDDDLSTLL